MPSDEYASFSGGTLKLKGGKVKKHRKKRENKDISRTAEGLERALSAAADEHACEAEGDDDVRRRKSHSRSRERSHDGLLTKMEVQEDDDEQARTEAEIRFEEAKRKRLESLLKTAKDRPELFKSHKQRVEELNSSLSKLSEHHDMPKIGPG